MAGKSKVRFDYSEFKKLNDRLKKKCREEQIEQFFESCAKELAARLLAKTIKRTPVGQYPEGSGKLGGTLRRGWTGESNKGAAAYAASLNVTHSGGTYTVEITNPIEYASYVEYGHRTANHAGWVEGKFMLTISENEIRSMAPAILQKKLETYLKGIAKK